VNAARLREGECEVCLKMMKNIQSKVNELQKPSLETIESTIKQVCKGVTDTSEKRFCYYIGGSEDAATSLLRTISKPLSNHLPVEKICEKLKEADAQICKVTYEKPPKPIDWATIDLNKMRVKELKQILDRWGEKCEGCTEKSDYLRLINNVKDKHIAQEPKADL
jgi:hypothetical protein